MLRIDQIRLLPGDSEELLRGKCAKLLRVPAGDVTSCTVLRKAIDAREGLTFVYTAAVAVRNEAQVLRRCRDRRVTPYAPEVYRLPSPVSPPETRPIVVGAGPAGLFAALVLAKCGARPILLERGQPVEQRQADVERFWHGGALDTESNVQFGEGGAGAFSDGKLNTGTKDVRHRFIMETLVRCGAPDAILTDAKPHVGTDKLHIALQALRQELGGPYDVVVANIVADVIIPLAAHAPAFLAPGGTFICSGIIDGREDEVRAAIERAGFTVTAHDSLEEWHCFTATLA